MEIKGIDVSSYQGVVDWKRAAASGYRYAVLRCMTRSGTDQQFERNYSQARDAGMKVGVYALSYALTVKESIKEAERAVKLLNGRTLDLPVYLDLEWREQRRLEKRQLTAIVQAFLKTIEKNTEYQTGIYCDTDWYKNVLDTSVLAYDYWIASYGVNDGKPHQKPDILGMAAWQYTSRGSVSGISGKADLDIFYRKYGREEDAVKKSGWYEETDGWHFYLGNTGEPVRNEWYQDGSTGKWYWFNGAGVMVHDSWYKYRDFWYYLGADGAMATGQQTIDGKWYIMDGQGRMIERPVTLTPDQNGALHWTEMEKEGKRV